MQEYILYDHNGTEAVAKVMMPIWKAPVEGVLWGERFFVWRADLEKYVEGALFYLTEHNVKHQFCTAF